MKAEKAKPKKSRASIVSNWEVILEVKLSLHFVSVNRLLCVFVFNTCFEAARFRRKAAPILNGRGNTQGPARKPTPSIGPRMKHTQALELNVKLP